MSEENLEVVERLMKYAIEKSINYKFILHLHFFHIFNISEIN